MSPRKPTPKQRQALYFVHAGHGDHGNLPELVGVKGGQDNQALFIQRLVDRGWIEYKVTPTGYTEGLGFILCDCGEYVDEDDDSNHWGHNEELMGS